MIKTTHIAATLAVALTLGSPAYAAEEGKIYQQIEAKFRSSDTNKDGKLTAAEAKAGGMTRVYWGFNMVDTQMRGYITLPQLKAVAAKRRK